jgi:hypothetical protein
VCGGDAGIGAPENVVEGVGAVIKEREGDEGKCDVAAWGDGSPIPGGVHLEAIEEITDGAVLKAEVVWNGCIARGTWFGWV